MYYELPLLAPGLLAAPSMEGTIQAIILAQAVLGHGDRQNKNMLLWCSSYYESTLTDVLDGFICDTSEYVIPEDGKKAKKAYKTIGLCTLQVPN